MEEIRYMISEASKLVEVEAHVLRYWEEEMELFISRNEMGHRYYREEDIELLKTIKILKEEGFQLKALKMILPNIHKFDTIGPEMKDIIKDELNGKVIDMDKEINIVNEADFNYSQTSLMQEIKSDEVNEISEKPENKMEQFKEVMHHIINQAVRESNADLCEEIGGYVTNEIAKEMRYLIKLHENKEEDRYRKFDTTLREYQKARMMTAIANEGGRKKKSKFFKKNKVYI